MISAIEKSRGFVTEACRILGCSRQHFYVKLNDMPTVQRALEDVREKRHDFVESKLLKNIEAGDTTAMIFYLKTQCKARGYVERHEVSGPDNSPIQLAIVERIVDANTPTDG